MLIDIISSAYKPYFLSYNTDFGLLNSGVRKPYKNLIFRVAFHKIPLFERIGQSHRAGHYRRNENRQIHRDVSRPVFGYFAQKANVRLNGGIHRKNERYKYH